MKIYLKTMLIAFVLFITAVQTHGHHHPHGPPPRRGPHRHSCDVSSSERRRHSTSENSSEEREKQFFNQHHLPDEDLEHFKQRMQRVHESVQICTHPHAVESNQTENKQALQENSQNLQKIIDFHIVIRSLIEGNKRKFAAIEEFVGYFKVNVPDSEIPQVIHDFILKILEIEQKDSITLQMSNEIEESIQKAQETQDHQETVQEMNEEARKLFAEKAQEFKNFLKDLIQGLKEIADKYNGQNATDEVNVNNQEPTEQTPKEEQTPAVEQPKEEQTPVVEQPKEEEQTPAQDTVSKEEMLKQKEEFEQKLKEMEEKQEKMQKQLNDLLNNQEILNQQQRAHQDKISQLKTLENGLDDIQHSKTQDTIDALNHLQSLQNHPDAQPFLKPLQDLYHALQPQSE